MICVRSFLLHNMHSEHCIRDFTGVRKNPLFLLRGAGETDVEVV